MNHLADKPDVASMISEMSGNLCQKHATSIREGDLKDSEKGKTRDLLPYIKQYREGFLLKEFKDQLKLLEMREGTTKDWSQRKMKLLVESKWVL